MSNLKRRYIAVTIGVVILLIITLSGGRVFGADKPVKPMVDFMFTPPNSIYAEYGFSDKTFKFFNFIKLREVWQAQDIQIAALRAEVDELKKQVAELKENESDTIDINSDEFRKLLQQNSVGWKVPGLKGIVDPNEVAK